MRLPVVFLLKCRFWVFALSSVAFRLCNLHCCFGARRSVPGRLSVSFLRPFFSFRRLQDWPSSTRQQLNGRHYNGPRQRPGMFTARHLYGRLSHVLFHYRSRPSHESQPSGYDVTAVAVPGGPCKPSVRLVFDLSAMALTSSPVTGRRHVLAVIAGPTDRV